MAKLLIKRPFQWFFGQDYYYPVYVDKQKVGDVFGETNEFEISPGQHTIIVGLFFPSNPVKINVKDDDDIISMLVKYKSSYLMWIIIDIIAAYVGFFINDTFFQGSDLTGFLILSVLAIGMGMYYNSINPFLKLEQIEQVD